MSTLTDIDITMALIPSIANHPIAIVLAAVRERCKARRLDFARADIALSVAREHYAQTGSQALAITAGQRKADRLADRVPSPPQSPLGAA